MTIRRWSCQTVPEAAAADLAAALGVPTRLAALLLARGCADQKAAERFLNPSLEDLHDPASLPDVGTACRRIAQAIERGEKMLVHGDYDADGVCATALLARTLRILKGDVEVFVPHRERDGYDLRTESVARAREAAVGLIITVDCGVVAHEAVEEARRLGIDLIVTDHHLPGAELPQALAVISPKRADSSYPVADLCGTALAYKLATCLVEHLGIRSAAFRSAFLDLVALATVADCMPLVDENRVLVHFGLQRLRATRNPGLRALMDVAGVRPDAIGTRTLGFALGPRINAAGRIDASEHSLRLLITDDPAEARSTAEQLERFNRERQQAQERIYEEAIRQAQNYGRDRILVLASARWHPGIIGIVASRIVETLSRPAVLVAINETTGRARGSARSIAGYHIFEALSACGEVFDRCGGHQGAAGFDMDPARVEEVRERLRAHAEETLPEDLLEPMLQLDCELPAGEVTMDLARWLNRLEPFGNGNPKPLFMSRRLRVNHQFRLSSKAKAGADHLKLVLDGDQPRPLTAIAWRSWPRAEQCPVGAPIDVAYELDVHRYQGVETLQLTLQDFRSAEDPV